ncbi:hypothetical protein GJ744_007173 [Endocarpon pusillum]|uniref:Uncharacterized protein n=1 Tax=Endocarpon pusillum TaxID=364733 RepID=A0A8H7E4D3_9EURO|nr:hypothetical protein GJ744_007173 [Endocarpon pusillum]
MAGIRDPAFWRRFSLAVHLDEEKANPSHTHGAASPASLRPELKHSDTWLERNRKKRSRMVCIGWSVSLSLVVIIAGIVLVILWLKGSLLPAPSAPTSTLAPTPAPTPMPPGGA